MNILDNRRVALQGGDHIHLHLQRTLLPYTQFIYPFDDISPSVSFFRQCSMKIRLSPLPTVSGFIRYALAEIDVKNAFDKSITMNNITPRIIAIIALNSLNK